MAQNNPLPDFFYHLAEAHAALQAVNDFDVDSFNQASQVEWEKLREEQSARAAALICYVQRHGDTLLKALADLESNRKSMQFGRTSD